MSDNATVVSVHLAGEGRDEISLDTLPGKITITRTDAALTPYGGLAAWSGFLKHLGIMERLADHCPVVRTSPNAAPVREVLHSFSLSTLVEGRRFCHVRWLNDDPAVATMMNMERVRGEGALPRLAREMSAEQLREWMHRPQTELYATLPDHFIADWDSTVNTRYGHQEDAAIGYNPLEERAPGHKPAVSGERGIRAGEGEFAREGVESRSVRKAVLPFTRQVKGNQGGNSVHRPRFYCLKPASPTSSTAEFRLNERTPFSHGHPLLMGISLCV